MSPISSNIARRWPQEKPKVASRWPKMAPAKPQITPRGTQDKPKTAQNNPKRPQDNKTLLRSGANIANFPFFWRRPTQNHYFWAPGINLSEHGNGKRAKSGESHRVSVGGRNPKMVQDSPGRMPRWPNMEQDNRCWSDETHLGNTRENATRHCLLRRLARRRMIFGTCQGAKVCSRSMKSLWRVRSVRANVLRIQIVILRQDASSKATKGSLSESESHHSKSSNMKTSRWYKWKKHH